MNETVILVVLPHLMENMPSVSLVVPPLPANKMEAPARGLFVFASNTLPLMIVCACTDRMLMRHVATKKLRFMSSKLIKNIVAWRNERLTILWRRSQDLWRMFGKQRLIITEE